MKPLNKKTYLNSFDDFLFEAINTSTLVISIKLEEILYLIRRNKIAERFLNDHARSDVDSKVTLLDVDDSTDDKWFCVNSTKANQYIEDNQQTARRYTLMINRKAISDKFKVSAKIGRIINKIYPGAYKPDELEEFINLYKKEMVTNFELVDIVKGKDINYWYNYDNYNKDYGRDTELWNSCMSPERKNHYMDMYAINGDKVELVVLYDSDDSDEINARALLWKPSEINGEENTKGELFMDRIYFNRQADKNLLQKYAKDNKWYYKPHNDSDFESDIYNPNTNEITKVTFKIDNIKIPEHHGVPYTDTMGFFNPKDNSLSNTEPNENHGMLGSTNGKMENLVWIEKYKKFFYYADVIYVTGVDGQEQVISEDAFFFPFYSESFTKEYIENKGGTVKVKNPRNVNGAYEIFKDDAVYSDMDEQYYAERDTKYSDFLSDYIPTPKAVYSNHMESYLHGEDSVDVIIDISSDGLITTDYYHIDDPMEPYFKHTDGKYYLKGMEDDIKREEKYSEKN